MQSMPSLSTLERACPPSRRRSCLACTKAKRRCDNTLPSCIRCSRRDVACLYPVRKPTPSKDGCNDTSDAQPAKAASVATQYTFQQVPLLDLELDTTPTYLEQACSSSLTSLAPLSSQPFLETNRLPSYTHASMAHTNSTCSSASPSLLGPSVSQGALNDPWLNSLPSSAPSPSPSLGLVPAMPLPVSAPLAAANWNFVSRLIATHLHHAMDIIRDAPRLFVLENRLPWSHPLLYRDHMPGSMEDAMSSCALYLAKNNANGPIILRTVDARLRDLLAAPKPSTPLECVAHVQALLLYNIMGIFDGDINARATVEKTQAQLQHSAKHLLSFITFGPPSQPPPPPPPSSSQPAATVPDALISPHASWDAWVLMESARRTFLISLYFMHLYHVMVGTPSRQCTERRFLNRYWTISASLWQATDAHEFSRACETNHFFLARVGNFSELLAEARPEDIDDFSQIFLSSLMGIAEFRNWMDTRGRPEAVASEVVAAQIVQPV